jgi:FMN phosphatase YigB (HAD superfamily)
MPEWIVFDAMGVIFPEPDDILGLLIPFLKAKNPEVSDDAVNEAYRKASLGLMDAGTFWSKIGFGALYPEIEGEYLDSSFLPDPGFKPLAKRLAKSFKIGLLSNDVGEWSRRLRAKFGLESLFSAIVISGDVGYRKPDPKIFEIFLEKSGTGANACVFIDDRLRNLASAKGLGMRTVLFDKALPDASGYVADAAAKGFNELGRILADLS